jgi:perosamine synthetase
MIPISKPYLPKNCMKYAKQALDTGWLSTHYFNRDVEESLSNLLGVKHVLLTCNGTAATHLLSKALHFKHPEVHDVIAPNIVYVAAWNSFLFDKNYSLHIANTDIDSWNFCIKNVNDLSEKNFAILVVPNLGNPIDYDGLPEVPMVQDACEAFGSKYKGKHVASFGLASSLSFFGNKNITCGEGGAFTTNDDEVADYILRCRGQGQTNKKYIHDILGYNYRMTNVQAAILKGQIEVLDEIIERKNTIWSRYERAFSNDENIALQKTVENGERSKWMFGVRFLNKKLPYYRTEMFFNSRGVEIRPMFYPAKYHSHIYENNDVYLSRDANGDEISKSSIMIPSFADLSDKDQSVVIKSVHEFAKGF